MKLCRWLLLMITCVAAWETATGSPDPSADSPDHQESPSSIGGQHSLIAPTAEDPTGDGSRLEPSSTMICQDDAMLDMFEREDIPPGNNTCGLHDIGVKLGREVLKSTEQEVVPPKKRRDPLVVLTPDEFKKKVLGGDIPKAQQNLSEEENMNESPDAAVPGNGHAHREEEDREQQHHLEKVGEEDLKFKTQAPTSIGTGTGNGNGNGNGNNGGTAGGSSIDSSPTSAEGEKGEKKRQQIGSTKPVDEEESSPSTSSAEKEGGKVPIDQEGKERQDGLDSSDMEEKYEEIKEYGDDEKTHVQEANDEDDRTPEERDLESAEDRELLSEELEAKEADLAIKQALESENEYMEEDQEDSGSEDGEQRFNYASLDAGAIILGHNKAMKSSSSLLVGDRDKYALAPCEEENQWVTIGLSEEIEPDIFEISNFERYSSTVRKFQVFGGNAKYPVADWVLLGEYEAKPDFGVQQFQIQNKAWIRYIKFKFLTHYGNEFYCTLTEIRVYGSTDKFAKIHIDIDRKNTEINRLKQTIDQAVVHTKSEEDEVEQQDQEDDEQRDQLQLDEEEVEQVEENKIEQEKEGDDDDEDEEGEIKDAEGQDLQDDVTEQEDEMTKYKLKDSRIVSEGNRDNVKKEERMDGDDQEGQQDVEGNHDPEQTKNFASQVEKDKEKEEDEMKSSSVVDTIENQPEDGSKKEVAPPSEEKTLTSNVPAVTDPETDKAAPVPMEGDQQEERKLEELPKREPEVPEKPKPQHPESSGELNNNTPKNETMEGPVMSSPFSLMPEQRSGDAITDVVVKKDLKSCPVGYHGIMLSGSTEKGDAGVLCTTTEPRENGLKLEKLDIYLEPCAGEGEGFLKVSSHLCLKPLYGSALATRFSGFAVTSNPKSRKKEDCVQIIQTPPKFLCTEEKSPEEPKKKPEKRKDDLATETKKPPPSQTAPQTQQRAQRNNNENSLESVFKSLTDKIMELEIDQSLFKKYLEEINNKYASAIRDLQKDQEASETMIETNKDQVGKLKSSHETLAGKVDQNSDNWKTEVSRLEKQVEALTYRCVSLENRIADILLVCAGTVAVSFLAIICCLYANKDSTVVVHRLS